MPTEPHSSVSLSPESRQKLLSTPFTERRLESFRKFKEKPLTGTGRGWELREAYWKNRPPRKGSGANPDDGSLKEPSQN